MLQLLRQRSFLILASISAINFYDYTLFGLIAAIISKELFPTSQEPLEFLYQILAIAVVIRPLGSYMLGVIGDSKGRIVSIRTGIILITLGTFLIAFLPNSKLTLIQTSLWLLFARMLIAGFITAEMDSLRIFAQENLKSQSDKSFGNSLITIFAQMGALFATLIVWAISSYDLTISLWRVPFIVGGIASAVMLYLTKFLYNQEFIGDFKKATHTPTRLKNFGLYIILKRHKRLFLKTLLSLGAINGLYYFQIIFYPTFLYELAGIIDSQYARIINCLGVIAYIFGNLFAAFITYKLNKESLVSQILLVLIVISMFNIYYLAGYNLNIYLFLLSCFFIPIVVQPMQLYLLNTIPISIKHRMYSLSHSFGSALLGSTLPYICTKLWYNTFLIWSGFGYFIALLSFLLLVVNFKK